MLKVRKATAPGRGGVLTVRGGCGRAGLARAVLHPGRQDGLLLQSPTGARAAAPAFCLLPEFQKWITSSSRGVGLKPADTHARAQDTYPRGSIYLAAGCAVEAMDGSGTRSGRGFFPFAITHGAACPRGLPFFGRARDSLTRDVREIGGGVPPCGADGGGARRLDPRADCGDARACTALFCFVSVRMSVRARWCV